MIEAVPNPLALHNYEYCIHIIYFMDHKLCLSQLYFAHLDRSKYINEWGRSFSGGNFILIPPPNFNFIPILIWNYYFILILKINVNFILITTRSFYPSPEIEFYPFIPVKNKFCPFIWKEHHHPNYIMINTDGYW